MSHVRQAGPRRRLLEAISRNTVRNSTRIVYTRLEWDQDYLSYKTKPGGIPGDESVLE